MTHDPGPDDDLLARVRAWIDDDPEPGTARTLTELLYAVDDGGPEGDEARAELAELFRAPLAFGTAGLRGLVGPGPGAMNRATVRRAAAGVASWIQARQPDGRPHEVVIGRDARYGSEEFVAESVEVLAGAGLVVTVLPAPVPTPVLAFAVREQGAAAGIMVTASHNPGPDNGYKVYDADGRQIDADQATTIAAAMTAAGRVTELPLAGAGHPLIHHVGSEIIDVYVSTVVHDLVRHRSGRAPVVVAHTALHGVGAEVVRRACRVVGFIDLREVAEQSVPDPDFPTVRFPNPEEPGALDLLLDHAARDRGRRRPRQRSRRRPVGAWPCPTPRGATAPCPRGGGPSPATSWAGCSPTTCSAGAATTPRACWPPRSSRRGCCGRWPRRPGSATSRPSPASSGCRGRPRPATP